MKMSYLLKIIFIVVSMLQISTNINAQSNHLKPVNGIFDMYDFQVEYYSVVRKVLFKGLSDKPQIRFLIIPSFTSEAVLDIEEHKDSSKYYLIYHKCQKSIWYSEDKESVSVDRIKKELSKESADLIKRLFKAAISKTRYEESEGLGLDGTNYYFTVDDFGLKTGTIWSPKKESTMNKLVEIGFDLIELTKKEGSKIILDKAQCEKIEKLIIEINN